MAARNLSHRNLWIIAALVLVTVALLAWFLGSGGGAPGNSVADVTIEASPGFATTEGRGEGAGNDAPGNGVAEAVSGALAPPATNNGG